MPRKRPTGRLVEKAEKQAREAKEQAKEPKLSKKQIQREEQRLATVQEKALEMHEKAKEAYGMADQGNIRLAAALFEIKHHDDYYRALGCARFKDYCKDLGIDYTKATRLTNMWDSLKGLNINLERLERLGWTKACELATIATEKNANMLMKKAETMSYPEFRELCLKNRGVTSKSTKTSFITIKVDASTSEGGVVQEAVMQACKVYNTEDVSVAIAGALGQWMLEQNEGHLDPDSVCALLARKFGGVFSFEPGSIEEELNSEEEPEEEEEGLDYEDEDEDETEVESSEEEMEEE